MAEVKVQVEGAMILASSQESLDRVLRAVNCHAELTRLCERLLALAIEGVEDTHGSPRLYPEFDEARAILAKAKE